MGVSETIGKVVANAEKLKANGVGNEANTRALLIDPMLSALGWDPSDLDQVEREVKVFEGTFLDYALKVDGAARLYVEAKGVSENLDDKKFIAQTINYANNDGVVWCVLTNGLRYRVYKTNEPETMDRKLLFEVELANGAAPPADKANLLRLISRAAVTSGELDQFGDRVFTDGRVRKALSELGSDPPQAVLDAVAGKLGHPAVPVDALRRSLARVLDAPAGASGTEPASKGHPAGPPEPPSVPKGQEYPLDHHLGNKSALINELFEEINGFAMSLGGDVTRRIRKQYVGYFRGKRSFFTVELQQQRALIYLSLPPSTVQPWSDEYMRDASKIGHFGMGDTEYSARNVDQLPELKDLVQLAYDASH